GPASRETATEASDERTFTSTTVLPNAPHIVGSTHTVDSPQPAASPQPKLANGLGVLVFSSDEEMIETVQRAVRARVPVFRASNVVQVVKIRTEHRPGGRSTGISSEEQGTQPIAAGPRTRLPERAASVRAP